MSWNSSNIVIIGGGSAGWMTASTLVRFFPNKNITLVESPNIATVGVGESTLGSIRGWTAALGIDEKDFMKHTDASYKLSIKFTDFYKKGAGGYHYPFGIPEISPNSLASLGDWDLKKYFYPDTDNNDYCRTFYPAMPLIENNKISINEDGEFGDWRFDNDVAYHFDATKFAIWLRDHYAVPRGVKHIKALVENITTNDDGVEKIYLDNGQTIEADLFVDCTGWKSLLLGEALEVPFISYNDMLPNNRAWATKVPYVDKEKELEPFTNSTALENGWVWNIPSWERIGTGYVYSDKYITKEDALEEFKNHLKKNMTISCEERINDDLEFKDIKMRVGIHEKPWHKNVVAIGLSCGFIEPLESNGLLTVHQFLMKLVKFLNRECITQYDHDTYNLGVRKYFDTFAEFVALHYALSVRSDSKYWKDNSRKSWSSIVERCLEKKEIPVQEDRGFAELMHKKFNAVGFGLFGGIHCIAHGMNYDLMDEAELTQMMHFHREYNYKEIIDNIDMEWEDIKMRRYEIAMQCPSLYEYLKTNIHTDK